VRIVINHLTRMQPGYICVAGIDLDTGRHVRPVTEGRRLGAHLWRRNHGVFDLGVVVDLGKTRYVGHPPESEDHDFDPRRATHIEVMAWDGFFELVRHASQKSLREIFGEALKPWRQTCTVDQGAGVVSLGSLIPDTLSLTIDQRDSIRLVLQDQLGLLRLPVTDLRLYEDDFRTPRRELVQSMARRIRRGDEVVLTVGLTRPWSPDSTPPKHWLQVNNILFRT
jgi:hypothetical protein